MLVRVHAEDGYPVEGVADPIGWLKPPRLLAAWTALYDQHPVGHTALGQARGEDDAARLWREYTGDSIDRLAIPVRLFVDPDHRRRGIARLLGRPILEYASEHELALAFDVMLKDEAAIHMYETAGCIRLGTVTHHHSGGRGAPAAVYVVPST